MWMKIPVDEMRSDGKEVLVDALERGFLEGVIDALAAVKFADVDGRHDHGRLVHHRIAPRSEHAQHLGQHRTQPLDRRIHFLSSL